MSSSIMLPVVLALAYSNTGLSYEFVDELYFDYYSDNSIHSQLPDSVQTPKFITNSLDKTVNQGDIARLPCKVENLSGFVLLWKRDEKIIALGSQIVNDDSGRFAVETESSGSTLVVRLVRPADQGRYTCQVSALKPIKLEHTLHIRVKPIIQIEEGTHIKLKEGDRVGNLTCNVLSGFPDPSLTWTRLTPSLTTPTKIGVGSRYRIEDVTRRDEGVYSCTADNGYGPDPSTESIEVVVLYKPEIDLKRSLVRTLNSTYLTELSCAATGKPKPNLAILKDVTAIISNTSVTTGDTVTITVRIDHTEAESAGEYICVATNSVGVAEAKLSIPVYITESPVTFPTKRPGLKSDHKSNTGRVSDQAGWDREGTIDTSTFVNYGSQTAPLSSASIPSVTSALLLILSLLWG